MLSNLCGELSINLEQELVQLDNSHPSLLITLSLNVFNHTSVPLVKKNLSQGDHLALYRYLEQYEYSNSSDPDSLVCDLNNAVSTAVQNFIPDQVFRPSKYSHWFSCRLIKLLQLKEKYHKKVRKILRVLT